MREAILNLEKEARALEPIAAQRKAVRNAVVDYSESFLEQIEHLKAYTSTQNTGVGLFDSPISEDGIPIEAALGLINANVDTPGLNPASGGHMGYIPGGGIYFAALGDYLADIFNRYAGIFYASPGAVRMENMLIRWMSSVVGYPSETAGNLTSGGSIANLIGIVTGRDAKGINSHNIRDSVIYLSQQSHHSINKAIRIAGLSECIVRYLPLDSGYRIIAGKLSDQIASDREAGLNPFMVVASAGTTDVGAIDPLTEIGTIAKENGLWYHIDAAYGGFFALTDEGKRKLQGIETSDSLAIDPHKGLFLPYGLGVVLVKDATRLYASHHYMASYMQDAASSTDEMSPADLSPELTKPFRGPRLWLPLKLLGVAPFRACLDEKLHLARYFYEEVRKIGFECKNEPEFSVVAFRYVPSDRDANEFNKLILERVVADGRVFVSSTMLDGDFTLRFACLSFRTHLSTVDLLLEVLKNSVESIQGLNAGAAIGN